MFTATTQDVRHIDMVFLRKQGYLRGFVRRSIGWKCGDRSTGSLMAEISVCDDPYMLLDYRTRSESGAQWRSMRYRVSLDSTSCPYGGVRWWFRCPNKRCNKRVRILYAHGDYFVCRGCAGLWYESQKYVRADLQVFEDLSKAKRLERSLKRRCYAGEPTRKYRQYLKLIRGMNYKEQAGVYKLDEMLI